MFRCELGAKIFLGIFVALKPFYSLSRNLVQKVIDSKLIYSQIFLPGRKLKAEHLNRPFPHGDGRIVIDFPQIFMDILQIILQYLCNSGFFLFHQRNIYLQLFHQALIRLYRYGLQRLG